MLEAIDSRISNAGRYMRLLRGPKEAISEHAGDDVDHGIISGHAGNDVDHGIILERTNE